MLVGLLIVTDLLAAGSAALGRPLADPVRLASNDWTQVLRCRTEAGDTVVLKAYPQGPEGAAAFAAEAAGLEFTAGTALAPELLACDPGQRLVVMTDLGTSPSLADLLLGGAPGPAKAGLLSWARACGELAVQTFRQKVKFIALARKYGAEPASGHYLNRRINEIPGLLASLSFGVPAGLDEDLAQVAAVLEPGKLEVFSPGDICPDNNLITAGGVRFIDFESAEYHSVFLDAAYLRMPFSTCWCVFTLPPDVAAEAMSAYRETVGTVLVELADDELWDAGLRLATAAWTLHALTYLLDRSLRADASANQDAPHAPTKRQLLRYRWQELAGDLDQAGALPALSALLRDLLARTEQWSVPGLPRYPAFR